jgi:putative transposase
MVRGTMIQRQLKLKLTRQQERELERWLFHLTSVWNWAIRKIELDAGDHVYYSRKTFQNLLANHGQKLEIPSHAIRGVMVTAFDAWQRCFKRQAGKPRFKGRRNKLTSIPFPDPIRPPKGARVTLPGVKSIRFHKQDIPSGQIKCGRIVRRASGWYLCVCIDAERLPIEPKANDAIGIDPGFSSLLTFSTGEKINHPRELERFALRLTQAQRGSVRKLAARLQERIANRRKDRNHKLSRRLVAENQFIAFSKDGHSSIAKRFGKSVASSGHAQLRQMLSYKSKCRTDGSGVYVEVDPRNSTKTCSSCGALSGPSGWAGLKVRQWTCAQCGAEHDRDVNAAINTLIAGAGLAHERLVRVA